ncbi:MULTISPECIES: NAD(P)-dependent malic enzyme [Sporosarcina]|uniref:Malate dehydrogenase (Oxaloacetate-decarboxylating) n=2 Tax=Sporosarcina newyorkensis TaxID=759851 RepID=A0A1T4Z072_9BACL|nr:MULTISPECIES: malic enzyme-like NAD(P)-binding protein [Sporosarcina]EGQ23169.1 NADP-dependent malate dehydrogenase (oxaloacetate-decarboxylating) [Sporosarcina newyorkensis 2681]MBY0223323.1 NAD-dependent malic enzyme [Sporosarcina aquimarina]SKB07422.1 malate dehydrogenase (oxaloacetate-decarboxylating) [Sporosarcina newyorkensis]
MNRRYKSSLHMHKIHNGKMETISKVPLENKEDLSLAYSPGVAEPCVEIAKDPSLAYEYTIKGNLVAVITDGTAVLGLGDIGPEAALPVMEGKALLLKQFAGIDSFPICLDTKDTDEIVNIVKALSPTFGAINLEDISAPRCFEIEQRLREECNIPIFHDDQHGTAIVVGAGLINALKLVGKERNEVKIVLNGAGAAGVAITKLLLSMGFENIIMCDSKGIIYEGREFSMNSVKHEMSRITNREKLEGTLEDAMKGADVFVGVSVANLLTKELIDCMNPEPIVFGLANPIPEIKPELAKEYGVRIIATGRSDYPNQVNNVLAFPGIFRGALDVRATEINEEMKLAATYAIADLIKEEDLREDYIIPDPFDDRVAPIVAHAVGKAAMSTNVSVAKEIVLPTR